MKSRIETWNRETTLARPEAVIPFGLIGLIAGLLLFQIQVFADTSHHTPGKNDGLTTPIPKGPQGNSPHVQPNPNGGPRQFADPEKSNVPSKLKLNPELKIEAEHTASCLSVACNNDATRKFVETVEEKKIWYKKFESFSDLEKCVSELPKETERIVIGVPQHHDQVGPMTKENYQKIAEVVEKREIKHVTFSACTVGSQSEIESFENVETVFEQESGAEVYCQYMALEDETQEEESETIEEIREEKRNNVIEPPPPPQQPPQHRNEEEFMEEKFGFEEKHHGDPKPEKKEHVAPKPEPEHVVPHEPKGGTSIPPIPHGGGGSGPAPVPHGGGGPGPAPQGGGSGGGETSGLNPYAPPQRNSTMPPPAEPFIFPPYMPSSSSTYVPPISQNRPFDVEVRVEGRVSVKKKDPVPMPILFPMNQGLQMPNLTLNVNMRRNQCMYPNVNPQLCQQVCAYPNVNPQQCRQMCTYPNMNPQLCQNNWASPVPYGQQGWNPLNPYGQTPYPTQVPYIDRRLKPTSPSPYQSPRSQTSPTIR